MADMALTVSGDWAKLHKVITSIAAKIPPFFKAQIEEDGEFVLERLKSHIVSQDLGWTPLSPHTVELKGGDTTIYVETGTLLGGMEAKKISWQDKDAAVLVGVDPNARHAPSGRKMIEILGWMEYGTDKQPPRPLMRPTYEEVKEVLTENWKNLFIEQIQKYAR